MKRSLLYLLCLVFVSLLTAGCTPAETESQEVKQDEAERQEVEQDNSSIVKEAIDQGKLALADKELEKAKSNFNLALLEDAENNEAQQWIEIIEKYEQFKSAVDKKEMDKATVALDELKTSDKYVLMKGFTKEPEQNMKAYMGDIEELEIKITALSELYNPDDESSMPSEDYLYFIEEILTNPNVTAEQKKRVEEFEEKATERVNSILAKMEEEMRAAEAVDAQNSTAINGITAEEAFSLITRLPSYTDLVINGDTFAEPRIYENSWIIDVSRPNGLAEGSIIVDENRTVSFMYPNGEVDEVTPY